MSQLFWCPNWYHEILSQTAIGAADINSIANKYPWHRFEKKELPQNKRGEFWLNDITGSIVTSPPLK